MPLPNPVRGLLFLAIALTVGACAVPEGSYDLRFEHEIPNRAMLLVHANGGTWGGRFEDNRVRFQLPKNLLLSTPGLQIVVHYESVCGNHEYALQVDGLLEAAERKQREEQKIIVGTLKLRDKVPTVKLYVAPPTTDKKVSVGGLPVRGPQPVEHIALPCARGRLVNSNGKLAGHLPAKLKNDAHFISVDKNRCWAFTTIGHNHEDDGETTPPLTIIRSKRVFGFDDNSGTIDYFLKKAPESKMRSGGTKLQVMPVDCSAGTALSKANPDSRPLSPSTRSGQPQAALRACQNPNRGKDGFAAPADWLGPAAETQALFEGLQICMVAQFWEPVPYQRHPYPVRRWDAALTNAVGAVLMTRVKAMVAANPRWKLEYSGPPSAPETTLSATRDHITVLASVAPPRALVSARDVVPARATVNAFLDVLGSERSAASAAIDSSRTDPRKFTFLCDFSGQYAVNFGFEGDELLVDKDELRGRGFKSDGFNWTRNAAHVTWKYGSSYFSVAHNKKLNSSIDHQCARWDLVEKRYVK